MITTPPVHLAPPLICNMERRMNIYVDEDSILWECVCEVVFKGFVCKWIVVGGVDAVNTRRWIKRHPHRVTLHVRPAVVA